MRFFFTSLYYRFVIAFEASYEMEERKINVFAKTLFKKNNSMKNGSKNIANLSSTQVKLHNISIDNNFLTNPSRKILNHKKIINKPFLPHAMKRQEGDLAKRHKN